MCIMHRVVKSVEDSDARASSCGRSEIGDKILLGDVESKRGAE